MAKYLVIVESPAKVKTIKKFLGSNYEVMASNGHVRDLPKSTLGIDIEVEDYIQFTKNKNEFVFKCNDKEMLPDIFLQFFAVWKNQIALLNRMQNQYLAELRDAILPDLMSGKIEL